MVDVKRGKFVHSDASVRWMHGTILSIMMEGDEHLKHD